MQNPPETLYKAQQELERLQRTLEHVAAKLTLLALSSQEPGPLLSMADECVGAVAKPVTVVTAETIESDNVGEWRTQKLLVQVVGEE